MSNSWCKEQHTPRDRGGPGASPGEFAEQVLERVRTASEPRPPSEIVSGLGKDREAERALRDLVLEGRVQLTRDWKVRMP